MFFFLILGGSSSKFSDLNEATHLITELYLEALLQNIFSSSLVIPTVDNATTALFLCTLHI
jgi:hypothetical protein